MRHSFARKPISILLSFLMVLSVFGGMTFSASAAAVTPKYKITINNKALTNSTTLPYTATATAMKNKAGYTSYSVTYLKVYKVKDNIGTISGQNFTITKHGSEQLDIGLKKSNTSGHITPTVVCTPITPCVCEVTGYTGTYDGEPHTIEGLTVTSPETGATVKYGTVSGTYNLTTPPSFTDAGTHTVYYQVAAAGWVTKTGSVNVVINPKTVTVTADAKSKIRGESDPALTYTAEGLFGEDTVTGELTREAGEAIGTYAIQQGTLAVGSNYTLAYTGANLTIEPNADDIAAANVDALINAIGEVAYTDECKTKIDEARAAYDALTDTQKALVTNATVLTEAESAYAAAANQAAADAVIAKINAIGEVELTEECWNKILAASTAYTDLTADQAALVTNVDVLTAASDLYNNMTMFENFKSDTKTDLDSLALPDDSAAATKIITDAKAAIDALTYDKTKSLDDNKATVTTAANISEALAAQRAADALEAAKAAFAAYKTTKKADLDALLQEGDSDEVKDIVGLAKTQVDGATYDESKTLDENKTALDTLVANVPTAIATQRAAEALAAAKTAAKAALDNYKNADDYRTAEKEDLATAIAEAKAAIDAAADIAAVEAAVAAAQTAMDAIKTDADLTAEELAAAKIAAKAALDNYKNAADYRTAEKEALATAIAEAKAAIDAAADLAAVEAAVAAAHTAMDAIKTDAELTAEEEAAAAAAALADAKAQLTTAVEAAKAFYDTIKDNEKYADIADALKTAYERGEAALASDDPAEILDFAANVVFATTTAQTDKAAADAEPTDEPSDPTDEPSTPDTPDTPSDEKEVKVGNPFLYNIIKAVVDFIVSLFTKVLPAAMKLK